MRDDLSLIVKTVPAGQDVKLYPLFDMHVGSQQYNEKAFKAFRDKVLSEPNSYVLVGGDLMDNGLKSSVTNVYEQRMRPSEQKKYLVEELRPLRERIICGTAGNHEWRSVKEDDDDPVYDVFCKLDIEDVYRPNACFILIRFGDTHERGKLSGRNRPTYAIMVTHGSGGGGMIGSGANKLERYGAVVDGLDVLCTGHTHKPVSFPVGKLKIDPQNNRVAQKQFTCVTATGWLDYGGYPFRKMLSPTAHAMQEIILSANEKCVRVVQ